MGVEIIMYAFWYILRAVVICGIYMINVFAGDLVRWLLRSLHLLILQVEVNLSFIAGVN